MALAFQRLQSLASDNSTDPGVMAALRAQDSHNAAIGTTLNQALVRGQSLFVSLPFTAKSPLVMPSAWQTPTLQNGWTALIPIQYRVGADGFVSLRGYAGTGAAGTTIFTLPSALWPTNDCNFATDSSGTFGKVVVNGALNATPGVVKSTVGTPLALDVVRFEPAAPASYTASGVFPFDVGWPSSTPPSLIIAHATDVTSPTSPLATAQCLPDWGTTTAAGGVTLLRVRNLPGLLPSRSYAVTLVGF